MVREVIVALLIGTQLAEAAPRGLALQWTGEKPARCQKLVEIFLAELRSMAGDRTIELDAVAPDNNDGARRIRIACRGESIEVREGEEQLVLRYLAKAEGFESLDWIPFQKRYLRPESDEPRPEIALAPPSLKEPLVQSPPPAVLAAEAPRESKPIYTRWWFWGLVAGAVGGGIYALTQSGSRDSNVNVEVQ